MKLPKRSIHCSNLCGLLTCLDTSLPSRQVSRDERAEGESLADLATLPKGSMKG